MGRLVSAGALVRDQADFYLPGTQNRATGVVISQLAPAVFADNGLLPWPLADGTSVLDSQISAGTIYFHEIAGSPGFYAVRFFPDRTGSWRVVLQNSSLAAEAVREYDVVPPGGLGAGSPGGLVASFMPGS